jgi:hypothetical protein
MGHKSRSVAILHSIDIDTAVRRFAADELAKQGELF